MSSSEEGEDGPSVEEIYEILAVTGPDRNEHLRDNFPTLLHALLTEDVLGDPVAYKVMQVLVTLIQGGILEEQGSLLFNAIDEMYSISDQVEYPQVQKSLDEITTALFSNACGALQMSSHLVLRYIRPLLVAMTWEGSMRWQAYSLVAPLMMSNIDALAPHTELVLKVMLNFPEALSIINELYKLEPKKFEENIPILMQLFEKSNEVQLSILHILNSIADSNAALLAPHFEQLRRGTSDPAHYEVLEMIGAKIKKIHPAAVASEPVSIQVESTRKIRNSSEAEQAPQPQPEPQPQPQPQPQPLPLPLPRLSQTRSRNSTKESIAIDGPIAMKGALRKRGRTFGRMMTRWYFLDNTSFGYYQKEKGTKPKRIFKIDKVESIRDADARIVKLDWAFIVQTRSKSLTLCASSEQERTDWVNAISKAITQ